MTIEKIGVGAGKRDFWEQPNVLRLFVGTSKPKTTFGETDSVWVLETNIDDVPAEVIGYCFEQLFAAGALGVFAIPIQMKKNRPGLLLSVIGLRKPMVPAMETILFRETATFGVRRHPRNPCQKLQRRSDGDDAVGPGQGEARLARRRGVDRHSGI